MQPLLIDKSAVLKDFIDIDIKEVDQFYLDTPFHFHNAYEIVLILKSSGRRIVGNNVENFTDSDLVLMGPGLPHVWYNEKDYYLESNNLKVQAIVIYFRPSWLTDNLLNSSDLSRLRVLLEDIKRGIKVFGITKKKVTKNIIKFARSKGLKRIIRLLTILELLSKSQEYECLASVGYINSYDQGDIERIDKIYKYVMNNYKEKIKLEDIANVACMTPTAFCKYFRIRAQKTFTNFVNEIRISNACKLICNENLSISEICYECGFNNFTNFNKNFKEFTKMSPTKFRTSLKIP